jgi:hypothetical protein
VLLALATGLATLRLSGVYFVIFSFGLAELIRQLVTYYQTQVTGSVGRYIFVTISASEIYWQLLGLCAIALCTGWAIQRSRLGFALRVIGDDETVAAHSGIDTARTKVLLFCISGALIALVGAVMAPRFTYIEPQIAYNPMVSFQVVIMALLGGSKRLWGPLVGVIPFVLLHEWIAGRFPNHTPSAARTGVPAGGVFRAAGGFGLAGEGLAKNTRESAHEPSCAALGDRPEQGLRRPAGGEPDFLRRGPGRDRRPDRAQRLGQDHAAQPDLGRAGADPGQRTTAPSAN